MPDGWYEEKLPSNGTVTYVHEASGRRTYIDPRTSYPQQHVQKVVPRRFKTLATASEIASKCDLADKVALITGANIGIGFETARVLALSGCHVYLACRSEQKALEAIEQIRNENAIAAERCEFLHLDLASLRSVRNCADQVKSRIPRIDILVLNAGIFMPSHTLSEDGIELTFQVCHLGHFYFTKLLDDLLDYRSRVVIVASHGHK